MDGEIILFMGVYVKGISILEFLMQPPASIKKSPKPGYTRSLGHFLRCLDLPKNLIFIRRLVFFLLELHKSESSF